MSVHALTALYLRIERVFFDFSCFFCFSSLLLPHCHLQADASLIRFFRFYLFFVFFALTVSAETGAMEAVFRLIELTVSAETGTKNIVLRIIELTVSAETFHSN